MSTSNCCFLTCIQISQEAGQVVWYSHLFQNFPKFAVVHTVKGFGIVNKAEIDVFLELSSFFNDPADVGKLISGSSAFSKTSLNIRSSWFMYCWSLYVYFDKNLTKKKNNDSNDYFQLTHFNQVTALILKFPSAWKKEGMEEFPSFPHSMELSSRSLDPLTEVAQTLLVVSDSLQSHWLHSARFLCSWNSPGKKTGVGSQFPSPGDLLDPGIKPGSPALQADSLYHMSHQDPLTTGQ